MFLWVALEENARLARILWIITKVSLNQGFLLELWKIPGTKATEKLDADTLSSWSHDIRSAWKGIANWQIKQLKNYTKSLRHMWMTTH